MVKIASWNVNSIKSRINHLQEYLKTENAPEIILLQELKCTNDNFPYTQIEDLGYNIAVHGQKTYNGVAILSKYPIEDIITTITNNENEQQARYIEAVITINDEIFRIANVYVPNGQDPNSDKFTYKLDFLDKLYHHCKDILEYNENFILAGDFNIAPNLQEDVYAPKQLNGSICCHPVERKIFRKFCNLDLFDAINLKHQDIHKFTWWDYRGNSFQYNKGLRIDHILLSAQAANKMLECNIDVELRAKDKPSDHAPVWAKFVA